MERLLPAADHSRSSSATRVDQSSQASGTPPTGCLVAQCQNLVADRVAWSGAGGSEEAAAALLLDDAVSRRGVFCACASAPPGCESR